MRGRGWVALALAMAVTASACIGPAAPTAPGEEKPVRGGRVIHGVPGSTLHLQPVLNAYSWLHLVYEWLVIPHPVTGEPEPGLARWQVSADGRTYTWEIDPAAVWSDGTPIAAADWLTAVKGVARSKLAAIGRKRTMPEIVGFAEYQSGTATAITGIETAGKKLTVRLRNAFCRSLLEVFALPPIPTHVFGKYLSDSDPSMNLDAAPENERPTVSSGPFILAEHRKDEELRFVRNERYLRGSPYLDEFVMKVVGNLVSAPPVLAPSPSFGVGVGAPVAVVSSATEDFRQGRLNLELFGEEEFRYVSEYRREPLRLYQSARDAYTYIGWNQSSTRAPQLRDKRVRQALAYALNLERAREELYLGLFQRAVAGHPPSSWALPSGLSDYRYDPARADELLRSAGYAKDAQGLYAKDGRPFELTMATYDTPGRPLLKQLLLYVADEYRRFGIAVTPLPVVEKDFDGQLRSGEHATLYDSFIDFWAGGPDPDMGNWTRIWHSESPAPDGRDAKARPDRANLVGFSAPAIDRAIEIGRGPDCSRATRQKAYSEFNRILNDEQPYTFLFFEGHTVLAHRNLRGLADHPASRGRWYPDVHLWWFAINASR